MREVGLDRDAGVVIGVGGVALVYLSVCVCVWVGWWVGESVCVCDGGGGGGISGECSGKVQ